LPAHAHIDEEIDIGQLQGAARSHGRDGLFKVVDGALALGLPLARDQATLIEECLDGVQRLGEVTLEVRLRVESDQVDDLFVADGSGRKARDDVFNDHFSCGRASPVLMEKIQASVRSALHASTRT
jgi:hypothetical protein